MADLGRHVGHPRRCRSSPHRHTSGAELLESSASAISRRASDLQLREPQKQDLAPFRLPTTPPVSPYQQGGRLRSDRLATFDRNRWPPSVGIGGRFASDSAFASSLVSQGEWNDCRYWTTERAS